MTKFAKKWFLEANPENGPIGPKLYVFTHRMPLAAGFRGRLGAPQGPPEIRQNIGKSYPPRDFWTLAGKTTKRPKRSLPSTMWRPLGRLGAGLGALWGL